MHFIRGFYYICLKPAKYETAAKEYITALDSSHSAIKAKHQLVEDGRLNNG